jgi:tRNA dimethylallyltransferase
MRRAIAIVGPTAAGKGELGREAARRLGRAVFVCDSVKVYRGLDIGSGKPTREMQAELPHRLIDLVAPDAAFSAGDYANAAWSLLPAEPGVFVGGTGFYLRQVAWTPTDVGTSNHDDDRVPADFDATWRAAEVVEPGAIWRALERIDPATASRIHAANLVRLVRALWLCERHGKPVSDVRAADPPAPRLDLLLVVLDPGPEVLAGRIERRVDAMLAAGWRTEVEMLRAAGYHAGHKAMQSLGYRQMLDLVEGRTDLASARADIIAATRRYARRQRTYFRHQFPGARIHAIASASACPWDAIEAFAMQGGESTDR